MTVCFLNCHWVSLKLYRISSATTFEILCFSFLTLKTSSLLSGDEQAVSFHSFLVNNPFPEMFPAHMVSRKSICLI